MFRFDSEFDPDERKATISEWNEDDDDDDEERSTQETGFRPNCRLDE